MSLINSKIVRSSLTLILASGVFSTMSGCTDNEIAASALIIGAAAILNSDETPAPHRYHHDRYVPRSDDGVYGSIEIEGSRRHDFAARVQSPSLSLALAEVTSAADKTLSPAAAAFRSTDARVIALAKNYEISDYAATYLVRAIVLAQTKDTSGIEALGLSVGDFKDLYQGKSLEAAKVEKLGSKLQLKEAAAAQLVSDLTIDVQAAKAARGL